jgi:hypothetical protein
MTANHGGRPVISASYHTGDEGHHKANQEKMEADLQKTGASQEVLRATIRACQEKIEAVVNTILYKFDETINKGVGGLSIHGLRPTYKQ